MVAEATVVALVGVVLGLVASCASAVPFAMARDEGVVPDGSLWLVPALGAAAVGITLAAAAVSARRATSRPVLVSLTP